jgi:hypothetical protein
MAGRRDERAEWERGAGPGIPEENVWASLVRATVLVGGVLVVGALAAGIAGRLVLYLALGR